MSRFLEFAAAAVLACALATPAFAQSQTSTPGGGGSTTSTPAPMPPDDAVPGQSGGIRGQNIFDVKPEVKRDASSLPGYMDQNNGQRNAVQPGNNAPMWRQVQGGVTGYTSLPKHEAPEAGNLIQGPVNYPGVRYVSAGEAWRQVRNHWIVPYGGSLLLITLAALAIFYFAKGPVGESTNQRAPRIERFTPFERAAHWSNAIAFVILGISGIVMAFGKFFLLPVIGQTLFGYLTYLLKNLHNFVGPLFVVSLLVILATFIKDNFPQKGDLRWLVTLGGTIGKKDAPTHRFNAGEKLMFWGAMLVLGIVVIVSGLLMDKLIPNVVYDRHTMQLVHMVHSVAAVLMLAALFGHIYMGTVGMRGAYTAMRRGYVDDAWAREHHAYWYEDIQSGKIPAQRSQPLVIEDRTDQVRPA
jgi:formate dehydrogenase subunit gamma